MGGGDVAFGVAARVDDVAYGPGALVVDVEAAAEVGAGSHYEGLREGSHQDVAVQQGFVGVNDGLNHEGASGAVFNPAFTAGIDVAHAGYLRVLVGGQGIRLALGLVDLITYIYGSLTYFYGFVEHHLVPAGQEIDRLAHRFVLQAAGICLDA